MLSWADVVARAAVLAAQPQRRLLGLAGAPGAGKSTVSAALAAAVAGAVVVPMDGFHLPTARLAELGRVERRGAPDTFDAAAFVTLLRLLRTSAGTVHAPGFDRAREEPVPDAVTVAPEAPLIVVEGNYLLLDDGDWGPVAGLLDEVWFVELDEPLRSARLIERFASFGMPREVAAERVRHGSDAANAGLVARTRRRADLVLRPQDWET